MDVRNVLKAVLPPNLQGSAKTEKTIKSESTTDRDANGQMAGGGGQPQHHGPMSDEQFEKALEYLRSTAAVKDNGLTVEKAESDGGRRLVLIKDPRTDKVIRRIMESELWSLQGVKSGGTGQLLRKTA